MIAGYPLSRHAEGRLRQRGVRERWLAVLLDHADWAVPVGSGATALSLSPDGLRELAGTGLRPSVRDRMRRLCAVVSSDGIVITAHKLHGRRRRAYRRGRQGYAPAMEGRR